MSQLLAAFQRGPKESFTRGDDHDVIRRIGDIPSGQGLLEAWFTVKQDLSAADPGVLQKHINFIPGPDGLMFLETSAGGRQITVVKFILTPAETLSFTAGADNYYWDFQLRSTAGHIGTRERGMLEVIEQVTQAA